MSSRSSSDIELPAKWSRWLDPALAGVAALFTLVVMLLYHPWGQAAQGDIALFQAFGRMASDGKVPYRDFFDQKTPLTTYANAFVALLSDGLHVDYVLAARGFTIFLFSLAGAAMYLLARSAGLGRVAALAAAGLFSAVDLFAWTGSVGLEPKVFATLLGIAGLLAAYKERWLLSGLACCLAMLAWQPEGVFVLAAAAQVFVVRRRSSGRLLGLLALGFIAPLLVLSMYFLAAGAFGDFWADTITFNWSYYDSGASWPPAFGRFTGIINESYGSDRWLFLLAAIGCSVWMGAVLYESVRRRRPAIANQQLPMFVATIGVLTYSAINFGDLMDVLPFVPLIAFWTAFLLSRVSAPLAARTPSIGVVATVLMLVSVLAYGQHTLIDQLPLQQGGNLLTWQRKEVKRIDRLALLEPNDPVYIVNTPWLSLLNDNEHLGRYHYFWNGVVPFAHDRNLNVDELTEPVVQEKPKLVVTGPGWWDLQRVLEADYVEVDPASLPPYFFPDAMEIWIRNDLPAKGSKAQILLSRDAVQRSCVQGVDWRDAGRSINRLRAVLGPVVTMSRTRVGSVKIDIGAPGKFSVVLTRRALSEMSQAPEQIYAGKTLCVQGVIRPLLGTPSTTIDDARAILVLGE